MRLIHDNLLKRILDLLLGAAMPCYIAGGYVREWLLGQPGKDVDFVVAGAAIPLAKRIADETGGAFYILDEETEAARIVYRAISDLTVDLAAMRGPDIIADLSMRDFTINAMAVDIRECYQPCPSIIDPCGGQRDLARRILRATSEHAFQEDPVRLLRALRFAATLNFDIEPETEFWIRRDASLITQASAERIRQELVLIVASPGAANHLRRMDDLGLLQGVIPELTALKGVRQPAPHNERDLYEHALATIVEAERLSAFPHAQLSPVEARFLNPFAADLAAHFNKVVSEKRTRAILLKFAAMLHDAGKPTAKTRKAESWVRFPGHEHYSAEIATKVLKRLRFAAQEIRLVSTIVALHMRPGFLVKESPLSGKVIYRFFHKAGDAGIDALVLSLADHLAARGAALQTDHWCRHLELTNIMLDNYFRRPQEAVDPPPLLNGEDIMHFTGLRPGPQVGQLLEAIREAQAEGLVRTRREAIDFLQRCVQLPPGNTHQKT